MASSSGIELLSVPAVQYGIGLSAMLEVITKTFVPALFYLLLEGLLRFLAAAVTHEVLGSLPLSLFAWSYFKFHERQPRNISSPASIRSKYQGPAEDWSHACSNLRTDRGKHI